MRIVLVGPASPWRGGIAHFNDLLARELSGIHDVHVLTFSRQYPSLLFPGKDQKHPSEAGLDVGAQQVLDSIDPLSWWRCSRLIRKLDPDLLIFRYWMPFFAPCFGLIMRWSRRGGRPEIVMVADNVIPHERRPMDGLLTRFALSGADRFVVMSASVKEDLLAFRPAAPVDVVPHPLYGQFGEAMDKRRAREILGLPSKGKVLLFFGFIRHYKGVDILLDALPRVLGQEDVHLLVVGEFYEKEEAYRRQVADRSLDDHVRFVSEYVANEKVAPYFCAADAVVLPYRHATQSGIIPVAYHLDRPVICTDVGGLGEIVKDGRSGLLVPPENPAALAEAILRFYSQDMEAQLVEGVRREKLKYGWNHFADAVTGRTKQEKPVHGQ